jgi:hypothetical protein
MPLSTKTQQQQQQQLFDVNLYIPVSMQHNGFKYGGFANKNVVP